MKIEILGSASFLAYIKLYNIYNCLKLKGNCRFSNCSTENAMHHKFSSEPTISE